MPIPSLTANCGACAALCCIATSFDASEDFGFDKPAGARCRHLTVDCRCGIHDGLAARGFRGCVAYDCYGAGQRATREFSTVDERIRSEAFLALKHLHELLWLLTEAKKLGSSLPAPLTMELCAAADAILTLAGGDATTLSRLEVAPHVDSVHILLRRVGEAFGERSRCLRALESADGLVRISRRR